MELDEMIEKKREKVLYKNDLDVNSGSNEVNIENIMEAIEIEASKLKCDGKPSLVDISLKKNLQEFRKISPIKYKLKSLDGKLRKNNFYNNHIRIVLKKLYKKKLLVPSVNVRTLLQYEDGEFVDVCYRNILLRDPDELGKKESLVHLRMNQITKIDFILQLANSEEGQLRGTQLEGEKLICIRQKIRRNIFNIPILGKCIRYIYKLFKVNNTIYRLSVWNLETSFKIDSIQEELNNIRKLEDIILNNQEKISDIKISVNQRLSGIQETIDILNKERLNIFEENLRNNNTLIDKHEKILDEYQNKTQKQLQNLIVDYSNYKSQKNSNIEKLVTKSEDIKSVSHSSNNYYSIDYFEFENRFRGSREHVKEVQRIYLPYFKNRKNVVDLGCGRGEFIELLKENNVGVRGIDLYEPYVEYCKMINLPVELDDCNTFLQKQESVDGIYVGQVVEHLTIEEIIALCKTAYQKLEDGAYLILETPNPKSLAIYTESFYKDPSHNKPVHPETLKYLIEKEGFSDVTIKYTESSRLPYSIPRLSEKVGVDLNDFDDAMHKIEELLYGSQDYAIIARK